MKLVKWLVVAFLVATSMVLLLPTEKKVRLGLDLQGGYSFTVELDEDALVEMIREDHPDAPDAEIDNLVTTARASANETAIEIIRNRIDSIGTEEPVITKDSRGRISVQMPGASDAQRERAEKMIRSAAFLEFRLVARDSDARCNQLLDAGKAPQGYKIADMGDKGLCYVRDKDQPEPSPSALRSFGNPGQNNVFMLEKDLIGDNEIYHPIIVKRRAELTGARLSKAGVSTDEYGKVVVSLRFDAEGTKKFAKVTKNHCTTATRQGDRLAVVLDGVVHSSPVLKCPILNGSAVIEGNFTYAEAAVLKNVLNAGAMPAPLKVLSKRFVNPTLGEDSIRNATLAVYVGVGAVLVFMLFYYRGMGIVADIALCMSFILLPLCAVLASGLLSQCTSDATFSGGSLLRLPVLTLPGIAGLLLSVGMAVDANVLIYERTREELEAGRPTFAAIMAGYERAFSAIFDGNLTTIITGIVLFIVGTGLIRGFAVTLVAGIIGSMFTALFVTKLVFASAVKETTKWKPGMMRFVKKSVNFPFVANFKKYAVVSVAIIVVSCAITVVRGLGNPSSVFGVDFTGGARVSYEVSAPEGGELPAPADLLAAVREAADKVGIDDAAPQVQQSEDGVTQFLEIKTVKTDVDGKEVSEVLNSALDDCNLAQFKFLDVDSIGSQVGSDLKKSAFWAVLLSTIAMLVYIGFRFEFGFGLGAIVALVHDVLITIGLFGCVKWQFNLTIVAALLTIVGYGVNDTIVLFDRVREDLKKDQKSDFRAIVNNAINATLSRTVLTSVTTLLPVIALIVFCQGDIRGFGICMLIGLITSTFSSIFIASPVMLAFYGNKRPDMRK